MLKHLLFAPLALMMVVSGPALAQDAAAGEKVFLQCRACHMVGEKARNGVGPNLNGLCGRVAGSVPGYNYSPANKASGVTWDEATFAKYIANPREFMKGTRMAYAGLKDPKAVADLTAFLKQFGPEGKKL